MATRWPPDGHRRSPIVAVPPSTYAYAYTKRARYLFPSCSSRTVPERHLPARAVFSPDGKSARRRPSISTARKSPRERKEPEQRIDIVPRGQLRIVSSAATRRIGRDLSQRVHPRRERENAFFTAIGQPFAQRAISSLRDLPSKFLESSKRNERDATRFARTSFEPLRLPRSFSRNGSAANEKRNYRVRYLSYDWSGLRVKGERRAVLARETGEKGIWQSQHSTVSIKSNRGETRRDRRVPSDARPIENLWHFRVVSVDDVVVVVVVDSFGRLGNPGAGFPRRRKQRRFGSRVRAIDRARRYFSVWER